MFLALRLERVSNQTIKLRVSYKIAQRYFKDENTSSHLAGVATIVDLCCWVPCQEFVLIIYDCIARYEHFVCIYY